MEGISHPHTVRFARQRRQDGFRFEPIRRPAPAQNERHRFFYATRVDGRWWLVNPEGCLFLDKGVSSVDMVHSAQAGQSLAEKFGAETNWAEQTTSLLRSNGFDNLGAWSDTERLRRVSHPLVYTRVLNFMSGYGQQRGGTYQQPGHAGYSHDCIFVFDPGFESFCDAHARELAKTKNDPWLLGYFSDNEMPLWRAALKNYLKLPPEDAAIRPR